MWLSWRELRNTKRGRLVHFIIFWLAGALIALVVLVVANRWGGRSSGCRWFV
jgi:hypothetical protein